MGDLLRAALPRAVCSPSAVLRARGVVTRCFCYPLPLVALQASKGLKGRAHGRVQASGPLIENHGAREWSLVKGSLEKVAFEPGLEGC